MTTETDGRVAAHTPGPWFRTGKGWTVRAPERPYVTASGTTLSMRHDVATVHQIGSYPGEREANARLIVAAPDLLEALRTILAIEEDHGDPTGPEWDAARAAFYKATGAVALSPRKGGDNG